MLRLVRVFMGVAVCVAAMTFTGATAFALETPTTGQPGAPTNTCGTANPVMPGASASAFQFRRPGGRRLRRQPEHGLAR